LRKNTGTGLSRVPPSLDMGREIIGTPDASIEVFFVLEAIEDTPC